MATEVNQHQINSFTTPQTGAAVDSSVVRGNFNTIQAAYVAHDADPGIHVQSSTLASRPTAATAGAGAKWINSDSPRNLYISDGTTWHIVNGLTFTVTNGQPGVYDAGSIGTGITVNWNNGPVQKVTLNDTGRTISFSNQQTGSTYTLILVQDGTGGRTVTLAGFDFGDNLPSYNTGANKKNVVSALYDGSEYLAAFAVKGA